MRAGMRKACSIGEPVMMRTETSGSDSTRCREISSMRRMLPQHGAAEVVTAQGRTVPATEIPWLRAREVYVHVVDLGVHAPSM